MRRLVSSCLLAVLLGLAPAPAISAPPPPAAKDDKTQADKPGPKLKAFEDNKTGKPGLSQGVNPSKIKPTKTEAALKFTVVDKEKGTPIPGIVVALTGADGKKLIAPETDAVGYTELLVPVGQEYKLVYLSLGQGDFAAKTEVSNEPNQTIKLTLRYKTWTAPPGEPAARRFVLDGVEFDTNKATLRPESFARLDRVVEYMTAKLSARVEIAGHTDNVGNKKSNKKLSLDRAATCRKYIVSKGIDAKRINAVGYGDERPIAPNDTEEGRQKNRRIDASEI